MSPILITKYSNIASSGTSTKPLERMAGKQRIAYFCLAATSCKVATIFRRTTTRTEHIQVAPLFCMLILLESQPLACNPPSCAKAKAIASLPPQPASRRTEAATPPADGSGPVLLRSCHQGRLLPAGWPVWPDLGSSSFTFSKRVRANDDRRKSQRLPAQTRPGACECTCWPGSPAPPAATATAAAAAAGCTTTLSRQGGVVATWLLPGRLGTMCLGPADRPDPTGWFGRAEAAFTGKRARKTCEPPELRCRV